MRHSLTKTETLIERIPLLDKHNKCKHIDTLGNCRKSTLLSSLSPSHRAAKYDFCACHALPLVIPASASAPCANHHLRQLGTLCRIVRKVSAQLALVRRMYVATW